MMSLRAIFYHFRVDTTKGDDLPPLIIVAGERCYQASLEKGKTSRQQKDPNDAETFLTLLEKTGVKIETIDDSGDVGRGI